MALFVFFIKLMIAVFILFNLVERAVKDRREKNVMLFFVIAFIVIVDLRNIIIGTLPENTVYEITVLLFLLYILTKSVGDRAKTASLMRNFIDLKALFETDIIENLEEGVALIRSDSVAVMASNQAYKALVGDGAFIALPEIVSAVSRGESQIELLDFENKKRTVNVRLTPYGKRYALINLKDVTELANARDLLHQVSADRTSSWDHAPNLMMLRNLEGKIGYLNEKMAAFIHRPRQTLVGRYLSEIYQKDDEREAHLYIHEQLISEQIPRMIKVLKMTYPMGAAGFMQVEEQIIWHNGEKRVFTSAIDVTELKVFELFKRAYHLIHLRNRTGQMGTYVVANLIQHDLLFKEMLFQPLESELHSLSHLLNGLSTEDLQLFEGVIKSEIAPMQQIIYFNGIHQFSIEEVIFSSDGFLIGVLLRHLNPKASGVSTATIGSKIVGHVKEGILIVDHKGMVVYSNEMIQRILNYTSEELLGKRLVDISLGLTEEILFRNMALTKQHNSLHFERIYLTKEGHHVPTEVIAMNLETGHADQLLLLVRDTSEKFIYKKRLIDSQSRYAQIFESLQDDIVEIKLPEKSVSFFREFDAEKGLVGMEISFLQWLTSVHDLDRSIVYEAIDIITSEQSIGHRFEYRYFKNSGWQWYRATGKYIMSDEGASIILVNQNISEIKAMTQSLDEQRVILIESERIAHMAHWKFQVSKNTFQVSETFGSIFIQNEGKTEVYYESFLESMYSPDLNYFEEKFKRFIWNGDPLDIVFRLYHHGKITFVNMIGQVYKDDERLPIYAIGSIADVTERSMTRQRFEESRQLLEHVVEQSPQGIIIIKNNGHVEKINHEAIKRLELKGLLEQQTPLDVNLLIDHLESILKGADEDQITKLIEGTTADGTLSLTTSTLTIDSNPMTDPDGRYLGRILQITPHAPSLRSHDS